jgi:hypothetical protein
MSSTVTSCCSITERLFCTQVRGRVRGLLGGERDDWVRRRWGGRNLSEALEVLESNSDE